MRDIEHIVIHYSATFPEQDIGVSEIRDWHLERGWRDIGYHFVIRLDGTVEKGRRIKEPGAHVAGHNARTIGICYVGGLRHGDHTTGHDTRTEAQKAAMAALVGDLLDRFPDADVVGHRDLSPRQCPGFDVDADEILSHRTTELPEPDLEDVRHPWRAMRQATPERVHPIIRHGQAEKVDPNEYRKALRAIANWLDEYMEGVPWYRRAIAAIRAIRDLVREVSR